MSTNCLSVFDHFVGLALKRLKTWTEIVNPAGFVELIMLFCPHSIYWNHYRIISPQIEELHCQLDKLELLLSAAEILEYHLYPQTIAYINETKSNEKIALEIIEILIKNNLKKPTNDLNVLLKHLIKLVKVYSCINGTKLHKVSF